MIGVVVSRVAMRMQSLHLMTVDRFKELFSVRAEPVDPCTVYCSLVVGFFLTFIAASIVTLGSLHGAQDYLPTPVSNAIEIARLQRQVEDFAGDKTGVRSELASMRTELSALRDRQVKSETTSERHTEQLADINGLVKMVFYGVAGLIGMEVFKRVFPSVKLSIARREREGP